MDPPAPAVKRNDFGHVETHRLVALMGALEIRCGGCDDTALLGGVDRRSFLKKQGYWPEGK